MNECLNVLCTYRILITSHYYYYFFSNIITQDTHKKFTYVQEVKCTVQCLVYQSLCVFHDFMTQKSDNNCIIIICRRNDRVPLYACVTLCLMFANGFSLLCACDCNVTLFHYSRFGSSSKYSAYVAKKENYLYRRFYMNGYCLCCLVGGKWYFTFLWCVHLNFFVCFIQDGY